MFRTLFYFSIANKLFVAAVLVASPCGVLAQHGGHGGGSMGGGAMGGGGRATGVDTSDDLKDFHQALAVQATSQQITEYTSMVKSTAAASAELRSFQALLGKEITASDLAGRGSSLVQAIDKARNENKTFLEGFSGRQKSGLKDTIKKLTKADSELAQKAKELEQKTGDISAIGQAAGFAQGLEPALTSFQNQQVNLGAQMSIVENNDGQDVTFRIPPVTSSVGFENHPIAVVTSGVISRGGASGDKNTFNFQLTTDLSDLQQNITEALRSQIDKADRCGERIAIQNANLTPLAPTSKVTAQLHYERWACIGRDTINEMVEGDGAIELKLKPAVGDDGMLRLVPEIGRVDAQGLVGELLRSGSLGSLLRDKISDAILSAVRHGGDVKVVLPPAAQAYATLHHAQFQTAGAGTLIAIIDGEIHVSDEKLMSLTNELKDLSSLPETMPR